MLIQYIYACLTMLPCPIWFWSRWASGVFLAAVFMWSIYNGATYYIDYYGTKFQRELEALKKDVAKWQNSPEAAAAVSTPAVERSSAELERIEALAKTTGAVLNSAGEGEARVRK